MLFVNLKDKNNPGLRRSVTAGDIPAQTFARMTSQVCLVFQTTDQLFLMKMNVPHRIWLRKNARQLTQKSKKTTYSYLSAQATNRRKQTPSSVADASRYVFYMSGPLLLSHRPLLPQRKCRYRQAQTRSADEPMTVSCLSSRPPDCADLLSSDLCNVRPFPSSRCLFLNSNVQIVAQIATTGGSSRNSTYSRIIL